MRRFGWIVVCVLALSGLVRAQDLSKERFSPERLEALQAAGELVLIDVFADWCPTCAQQQVILADYLEEHPSVELHILEIDFDDEKEWVRRVRAPRQSTLILYRGEEQFWYSVAETRRDVIFAELNKAAGTE